jgi:hypothetical protein
MKQAFSIFWVLLVLLATTARGYAEDEEVEVNLDVEPMFHIFLKKNTSTGPDWTSTSTTLSPGDFVTGEKELRFFPSNLASANPTGRVWYKCNTAAVVDVELMSGGTFDDAGLELWVRQSTSVTYVQAVVGSATQLFTAISTLQGSRDIWLKIKNITWDNTNPGTYSETLVFTIHAP